MLSSSFETIPHKYFIANNLYGGRYDYFVNIFILLLVIILIFVIYKSFFNNQENMSAGTLTQLYANDAQDTYLSSTVGDTATGDFQLFWNHPTRLTNDVPLRGQLVPQNTYGQPVKLCGTGAGGCRLNSEITNPTVTDNSAFVSLNGELVYPKEMKNVNFSPDSYVGSYYTKPIPDIMNPYPYIPDPLPSAVIQ